MAVDFDSPWKDTIEKFLRDLLELCFPEIAAAINWSTAPEFLDTELHEVMRGSIVGRQHVDKLVRVTLHNGEKSRILLHLEVQHAPQRDFAQRLYWYHKRLEEKGPVVTAAILADTQPDWRPSFYESGLLGCRVRFDFPVCKLLDLAARKDELEKSLNPVAMLVLANWAAQQTGGDDRARYRWKRQLMRNVYDKGFRREDIVELYRLIDWLLELPEPLEKEFRADILTNEEQFMRYLTGWERIVREEAREEALHEGREEGRQEGLEQGRANATRELIKDALLVRFGSLPSEVLARLESECDPAKLKSMHHLALTSGGLDQFVSEVNTPGSI